MLVSNPHQKKSPIIQKAQILDRGKHSTEKQRKGGWGGRKRVKGETASRQRMKGGGCLERDAERRKERCNKQRKERRRVGLGKLTANERCRMKTEAEGVSVWAVGRGNCRFGFFRFPPLRLRPVSAVDAPFFRFPPGFHQCSGTRGMCAVCPKPRSNSSRVVSHPAGPRAIEDS